MCLSLLLGQGGWALRQKYTRTSPYPRNSKHHVLAGESDYTVSFTVPNVMGKLFDVISRSGESVADLGGRQRLLHLVGSSGDFTPTGSIGENAVQSALRFLAEKVPAFGAIDAAFAVPAIIAGGIVALNLLVSLSAKSDPYEGGPAIYNVEGADEFYRKRPWLVIGRMLKILFLASGFNVNLLLDWRSGSLEKNEKERAKQALNVLSKLGPTFVKLGQALSIRTDIISETYANELKKLQDAVPPFSDKEAKRIIREQLGITDLSQKFATISPLPVASASIGQVYKATLRNGKEVAVKVQRY